MRPKRPDCFEFAFDFLGGDEAKELLAYVEELEKEIDRLCGVKIIYGAETGRWTCTLPNTTNIAKE